MQRIILLIAAFIIQPFAGLVCVGGGRGCGEWAVCATGESCRASTCGPRGAGCGGSGRWGGEPESASQVACCGSGSKAACQFSEIPADCDPKCCLWTNAPPMPRTEGSGVRFVPLPTAAPEPAKPLFMHVARASGEDIPALPESVLRGRNDQRTRRAMLCVRTI